MSPTTSKCTRPDALISLGFTDIDNNLIISCEELAGRAGQPDVRIVDCRFSLLDPGAGRQQYLTGHIPNAVYADLDKDLAAPVTRATGRHPLPHPETFAATLGRLGIGKGTQVVAYDQDSGALAARLWWMLRWVGHTNALLLDGGLARWNRLGLPLRTGQQNVAQTTYEPDLRSELVLQTDEIVAALPHVETLQLVDAREARRFDGLLEPIDPVAGHIPGTTNVPVAASLHDDATWKTGGDLRGMWREALGDGLGAPWSVMCGSGVTACHLVVSALMAGLREPRVYIGSWSEWIRDPARPVDGSGLK